MGKLILSLDYSLPVNINVEVMVWSRPSCICRIPYFKFNGVDLTNIATNIEIIQ
jgi:hypothetical protein